MTITPQQLIALLPLLIVGLTVVVVMLSIAWRRNHFLNATLSVLGLNAALVSLWFVGQNGAMDVTPLIRVDGYAMLYTGLVLLASLATCTFAYPWLEGYKDNKEEFYLLVLIAALGGILLASRIGSSQVNAGGGYLMDAVAAAWIGFSLAGSGKPNALGTLVGAVILGVLSNGLVMLSVPYYAMDIIKGLVLAGALALTYFQRRT